jgi:hypothetical protein
LKALWHDSVWSKVIAGVILGALGVVGAYVLRRPSAADRLDGARIQSHRFSVYTCKKAQLNAHVEAQGVETFVWFEWGETPDLGKATIKQRFTDNTEFYQTVVGLKENTTYFYRAMASNSRGSSEGRVLSFTSAHCE